MSAEPKPVSPVDVNLVLAELLRQVRARRRSGPADLRELRALKTTEEALQEAFDQVNEAVLDWAVDEAERQRPTR